MRIAKQSNYKNLDFDNKNKLSEFVRSLDADLYSLFLTLQGRVRFGSGTDGDSGENVHGQFQVVSDTGIANTEFAITHTLGSVPIGYLVLKTNNAGVIHDSGTTWTATNIYLKSSSANSAITLFLIK